MKTQVHLSWVGQSTRCQHAENGKYTAKWLWRGVISCVQCGCTVLAKLWRLVGCPKAIASMSDYLFQTRPDHEWGIIGQASLLHSWHWVLFLPHILYYIQGSYTFASLLFTSIHLHIVHRRRKCSVSLLPQEDDEIVSRDCTFQELHLTDNNWADNSFQESHLQI